MVVITDLNWNVIETMLGHAFQMDRPRPHAQWHLQPSYMSEPLLSVALTCRQWSQLVRQLLTQEVWFRSAYLQSLRLTILWQRMGTPAFCRLSPDPERHIVDDRVGDLNAVDVPGTAAYFASAIFNSTVGPDANHEFRTNKAAESARFQIRDEEAMDTFLATLDHDMLQLMEKAVLYVAIVASNEGRDGRSGRNENAHRLRPSPLQCCHLRRPQQAAGDSLHGQPRVEAARAASDRTTTRRTSASRSTRSCASWRRSRTVRASPSSTPPSRSSPGGS